MFKGQIPESWASTTLETACSKITDGTHYTPKLHDRGVPFVTVTHIENGIIDFDSPKCISRADYEKNRDNCQPHHGDVLFSKDGTVGKVALVDFEREFIVLSSLAIIRPRNDLILSEFMRDFLRSPLALDQAVEKKTGSAIRRLILKNLRQIVLPIPPVTEQKRIVLKIESTQRKIKEIESSLSEAAILIDNYRESLLQKAFRGRLVSQNDDDEPASEVIERIRIERSKKIDGKKKKDEFKPVSPEEIPFEIPKSWKWVRLGELAEFVSGYAFKSSDITDKDTGVQLVRIGNVTTGGLNLEKAPAFLPKTYLEQYREFSLRSADLLISLTGTVGKEDFGNAVLVKEERSLLLNQRVLAIRSAHSKFLSEFFRTRIFLDQFFKLAKGQRQANVSTVDFKGILVPFPPVNEQKRIEWEVSTQIGKIETTLASAKIATEKLAELKSSILCSAFLGKLVPQLAVEGSGEELLSKIEKSATLVSPGKDQKKRVKK